MNEDEIRGHSWDVDYHTGVAIQEKIAQLVDDHGVVETLKYCAGVDVSYSRLLNRLYAAVIVFDFESMTPIAESTAISDSQFPYIPGLLTFREGPVVIEAFTHLTVNPDVIIFDGQGIAHPRRAGLAAHMGVLLDLPSIGCAKKPLVGTFNPPANTRGSSRPVHFEGSEIARVVRTRTGVKPVYVSVGHRISLEQAVDTVLKSGRGYRLPEPTRLAHHRVNELRKADLKSNGKNLDG